MRRTLWIAFVLACACGDDDRPVPTDASTSMDSGTDGGAELPDGSVEARYVAVCQEACRTNLMCDRIYPEDLADCLSSCELDLERWEAPCLEAQIAFGDCFNERTCMELSSDTVCPDEYMAIDPICP